MNIKISDELKSDLPQSLRGKILGATPVVMAVLATMLAGLSSSEMTSAQYDRSLAAQQQSKAGDQWGFFQAKRLRGALQRSSSDLLVNTSDVRPLDWDNLKRAADQLPAASGQLRSDLDELLSSANGQATLAALQKGELPTVAAVPVDPRIKAANDAIEALQPESEIATLLGKIDRATLEGALRAAQLRVQAFDQAMSPTAQALDRWEMLLARTPRLSPAVTGPSASNSVYRDFTAMRLRYASLRYDAEARLNQTVATLYELEVRQSNLSAERHHVRSQRFFFGMLAAQLAVIVSTFALAARRRNLLWSIAAAAGLGALAFATYVYLRL